MRRVIHRPRIVAAIAHLDKLPVWFSFPVGLVVGVGIGVAVMSSHVTPRAALLATIALGAALWLGVTAPRPVEPAQPDRAPTPDRDARHHGAQQQTGELS